MKKVVYKKLYFGTHKGFGKLYLSPPSWDCGWYWGFGYLGNKKCHLHFSSLDNSLNMYDAIKKHFSHIILRESHLYTFCELMSSFYKLKEMAEFYKHGKAGYTSNPLSTFLTNTYECNRINEVLLPVIFEEIYKILLSNKNNEDLYKEMYQIELEGSTEDMVYYMKKHDFRPKDLKVIDWVSDNDYYRIHKKYCEMYHNGLIEY